MPDDSPSVHATVILANGSRLHFSDTEHKRMKTHLPKSLTSPPTGRGRAATTPATKASGFACVKIKVFVVEDHALMRRSLVETIERGLFRVFRVNFHWVG